MALVESFSGIRGIYNLELTKDVAAKYAQAFSDFLNKKYNNPKVIIGRDSRTSGKEILQELIKYIDGEIIDIGILPTPLIENAVRDFNADGGIIITASHNEPEFNGFKFLDNDGAQLKPSDMEEIISLSKNAIPVLKKIQLSEKRQKALEYYKQFTKNIIKMKDLSGIKIVIDPNGGSGIVSKEIFSEYNIEGIYLNMEYSKFNRLVEPCKQSLSYLKQKIDENNADFAIGFDCDADRVEILLKNNILLSGNDLLALFTDYFLSKNKNPSNEIIVVNDATSYIVKEVAEKYNAKYSEVEVGETNVVNEMKLQNSLIGGEGSSGGVIMPPSKCRDGILSTIYLLQIMKEKQESLEQIIQNLPKYYYIKDKVKLARDFTEQKDKVRRYYLEKGFEILETGDETGGLKAIKDNSWIHFRQSKTEDKILRIIADSKSQETSEELLNEARGLLE